LPAAGCSVHPPRNFRPCGGLQNKCSTYSFAYCLGARDRAHVAVMLVANSVSWWTFLRWQKALAHPHLSASPLRLLPTSRLTIIGRTVVAGPGGGVVFRRFIEPGGFITNQTPPNPDGFAMKPGASLFPTSCVRPNHLSIEAPSEGTPSIVRKLRKGVWPIAQFRSGWRCRVQRITNLSFLYVLRVKKEMARSCGTGMGGNCPSGNRSSCRHFSLSQTWCTGVVFSIRKSWCPDRHSSWSIEFGTARSIHPRM